MECSTSTDDLESLKRMHSAHNIRTILKKLEEKISSNSYSGSKKEFFETAVRFSFLSNAFIFFRLADLFGDDVVVDGLAIAENGLVRIVRDDEGVFPALYEVFF